MQQTTHSSSQYRLPDLLSISTAFTDATNRHWARASIESKEWVNSYHVFSESRSRVLAQGQHELLAAHGWPYADYEEFRTCCDYVNLLFVVDEISDAQGQEGARQTFQAFVNAFRDAEWDDRSIVAKVAKAVRNRLSSTGIGPRTYQRFVECTADYMNAVVEEARLRENNHILDLDGFRALRRNNSAVTTVLSLVPYCLHIDLPDHVIEHPVCQRMFYNAVDMVSWANDLYSYNMEQSKGLEGVNILTVLMKSHGFTLQDASDYVGAQYKKFMDDFVSDMDNLPSFGAELDESVRLYFTKMSHWCIGNVVWSFETPRYFGARLEEVKKTGIVTLLPIEEE